MDRLNYTQAAKIIFNHRNNRLRIKNLPSNCSPNNFEDAYKIQDELKKIYMSINDNFLIGKKVGCTNEWAQKQKKGSVMYLIQVQIKSRRYKTIS